MAKNAEKNGMTELTALTLETAIRLGGLEVITVELARRAGLSGAEVRSLGYGAFEAKPEEFRDAGKRYIDLIASLVDTPSR